MGRIAVLILIGSSSLTCFASRKDLISSKPGRIFEGWACAPNIVLAKRGRNLKDHCRAESPAKNIYLYIKFSRTASRKTVDSGNQEEMEESCRQNARKSFDTNLAARMLSEIGERNETAQFEDMHRYRRILNGHETGLFDCCAVDEDTGGCAQSGESEDWKQCLCVGYVRYPGGQKRFIKRYAEFSKEQPE